MKKVGISTVYTGYNYGSALQAYASKLILKDLGYDADLLSLKGSLIKGRDFRLNKLLFIMGRLCMHPVKMRKRALAYKNGVSVEYSDETKQMFETFKKQCLQPKMYSWKALKEAAHSEEYFAFLCGSDQIWNGDILYVDPQYYLRYAPRYKRIAFAPSFGRKSVADYNEKTMKKYISGIRYLSVREDSGVEIVEKLVGRKPVQLLDPTLILPGEKWTEQLDLKKNETTGNSKYLLAYFLNEPSKAAKKFMKQLAEKENLEIIALPYDRKGGDWYTKTECAGPLEFLTFLKNAEYVCTDSFHGTAFSINLEVPYYTFEREYGKAENQSSRLQSVLKLVHQENRFNPTCTQEIDFAYAREILAAEREKARKYLTNALNKIGERHE